MRNTATRIPWQFPRVAPAPFTSSSGADSAPCPLLRFQPACIPPQDAGRIYTSTLSPHTRIVATDCRNGLSHRIGSTVDWLNSGLAQQWIEQSHATQV